MCNILFRRPNVDLLYIRYFAYTKAISNKHAFPIRCAAKSGIAGSCNLIGQSAVTSVTNSYIMYDFKVENDMVE